MPKESKDCCACGRRELSKDEIGACKKLLGPKITNFFCLPCLAEYLGCEVDEIEAKIEEFKAEGCKLFR